MSAASAWEYVHVCIDDHARVAFAKIMPNEKKRSAIAFLKAAIAYYASLGIKVERVMTDNGSCYKSFAFRSGLQTSRPAPHQHQTLYAEDQWQGRALHPDQPARMGLCSCL
jgi:transposase InsO family protein